MADRPRGLGPCDVLTVAEAVRVLGFREAEARSWLYERGLVKHFAGRPRVIAGELAAACDEAMAAAKPSRKRAPPITSMPTWDEL